MQEYCPQAFWSSRHKDLLYGEYIEGWIRKNNYALDVNKNIMWFIFLLSSYQVKM